MRPHDPLPVPPVRTLVATLAAAGACAALPASAQAIVGGRVLPVGEAPWLVQVREDGRHTCTGSLVRPRLVLTAAHCLESGLPSSVALRRQRTSGGSDGEVVAITRYGVNPRYVANQRRRSTELQGDVALLELARAPADPVVLPLAGPSDASLVRGGRRGVASGWGQTAGSGRGARTLRTVGLPLASTTACRRFLGSDRRSAVSLLCAGSTSTTAGACFGDSGGPLYAWRGGRPFQVAIATSTTTRTCRRSPTIYNQTLRGTNREWIDEAIERAEATQPPAAARTERLPGSAPAAALPSGEAAGDEAVRAR